MAHHVFHRAAVSGGPSSPDFAGLTRIEWTAESLDLADSDPVSSWTDVGPNALSVTNTGTARPTYNSAGYVTFDGIDDDLEVTGLSLDFSGGFTMFWVGDLNSSNLGDGPVSGRATGENRLSNAFGAYAVGSGFSRIYYDCNRDIGADQLQANDNYVSAGTAIYSCRYDDIDPGDDPIYRNGSPYSVLAEVDAMREPQSTIAEITIGSGYGTGLYTGDIYAIVLYYGADMTNAQVEEVHANLNARFSVY